MSIVSADPDAGDSGSRPPEEVAGDLDDTEHLGLAALRLRESNEFLAAEPTSAFLEGSVAVGIVIVEGPTAALQ